MCKFLKDIARYIDGLIVFAFESDAEGPAYLWFENGKVKIKLPTWTEYAPEDLIRIRRETKRGLNKQYKLKSRAQAPKKTSNRSAGRHINRCSRCGRFVPKSTVTCCSFDYMVKGVKL